MNDIEKAIEILNEDVLIMAMMAKNKDVYDTVFVCRDALEKQLNNGWILVAERLPNRETGCLVWQKIDGHYKYNIWHYVTDFPSSVIAWQPLPSTYKEVE